jgi:hypothetical protein
LRVSVYPASDCKGEAFRGCRDLKMKSAAVQKRCLR